MQAIDDKATSWTTIKDDLGELRDTEIRTYHKLLEDSLTPSQLDAAREHALAYRVMHSQGDYVTCNIYRTSGMPAEDVPVFILGLRATYQTWATILQDESHKLSSPQTKHVCDEAAQGKSLTSIGRDGWMKMSDITVRKLLINGLDLWAELRGWDNRKPPRANPLPSEREILDFIKKNTMGGKSPSYRRIGEAFNIRSTNAVSIMLERFEAKGFIWMTPGKHGGIMVLV